MYLADSARMKALDIFQKNEAELIASVEEKIKETAERGEVSVTIDGPESSTVFYSLALLLRECGYATITDTYKEKLTITWDTYPEGK